MFYFQFYPLAFSFLLSKGIVGCFISLPNDFVWNFIEKRIKTPRCNLTMWQLLKGWEKVLWGAGNISAFSVARTRRRSLVLVCWCGLTEVFTQLLWERYASKTSLSSLVAAAFLYLKIMPSSQALYFWNCYAMVQNFPFTWMKEI